MGIPRRGGPSGRYQSWLRLSKKHKELRKLIPIYFPVNLVPSTDDSDSYIVQSNADTDSNPTVGSTDNGSTDDTNNKDLTVGEKQFSARHSKHSFVWNIDGNATTQLHDLMNPRLIYQSLNMSPIHWKSVPQLCALDGKHCAALCGVIIKKCRKKSKRMSNPSMDNQNTTLGSKPESVSLKERNGPESAQRVPETSLSIKPEREQARLKHPSNSGGFVSDSVELESTIHPSSVISSISDKENIPRGRRPTLLGSLKKEPDTSATEPEPAGPCRFCCKSPQLVDRRAHATCNACNTLLRSFCRACRSLEDFVCLRDVTCSVRWPVSMNGTEIDASVNPKLQEYGPIVDEWCDPCKVVHCVKLGCKLINFCGNRITGFSVLRGFAVESIDNPELVHRTRERRVHSYLSLLKRDFNRFISLGSTEHHVVTGDRNQIAFDRFLDLLWVRPVHLLSRQQLNSTPATTECFVHSEQNDSLPVPDNTSPEQPNSGPETSDPRVISTCDLCRILQLCSTAVASSQPSAQCELSQRLLHSSMYEITLGPLQIGRRSRPSPNHTSIVASSVEQPTTVPLVAVDHSDHGSPAMVSVDTDTSSKPTSNEQASTPNIAVDSTLLTADSTIPDNPMQIDTVELDSTPLDIHDSLTSAATVQCNNEPGVQSLESNGAITPSKQQPLSTTDSIRSESESQPLDTSISTLDPGVVETGDIDSPTRADETTNVEPVSMDTEPLQHETVNLSELADHQDITIYSSNNPPESNASQDLKSNPAAAISVCGPCLLRIRRLASKLLNESAHCADTLATLLSEPNQFCSKISELNSSSGRCSEALCDQCCLYECLTFIYQRLCSQSESNVSPSGSALRGRLLLPVGGPLFLPTGSSEGNTGRLLFASQNKPQCLLATTDQSQPHQGACLCCGFNSESLSHYLIGRNDFRICSGCLWTFKAELQSATTDPRVLRIARHLTAATTTSTDTPTPLLSSSCRRTLIDTARLAYFLGRPCTSCCFTQASNELPVWFICPACTVRRCFRLLPASVPVHPPTWYRRRLQLFSRASYLADLDPRLRWPRYKVPARRKTPVVKTPHRKLALTDVEFISSVIERLLTSKSSRVATEGEDSSSSSEDHTSGTTSALSDCSSGFSLASVVLTFSDHESDFGGPGWWTISDSVNGNDDSSATEPERDAIRAEELTIPSEQKRRRPHSSTSASDQNYSMSLRAKPEASDSAFEDGATADNTRATSTLDKQLTTQSRLDDVRGHVHKVEAPDTTEPADRPGSKVGTKSPHGESSQKPPSHRRKCEASEELILRGKRRLKINHRFLDDFDGSIPRLTGHGRRSRYDSGESRDSSGSSRTSGSTIFSRKTSGSNRASLMAQKKAHARLNSRSSVTHSQRLSGRESRSVAPDDPLSDRSPDFSSGPRVKQISRTAIKPSTDETRYGSTLSAMIHAARLAAVGAKIPGGTSPNHAALAATTHSNVMDDRRASGLDMRQFSTKTGARSLPDRCGQCPACCGLIQPCGRCTNCRSLQESTKISHAQPCIELICFRRRPNQCGTRTGPRVKLPCNFPPPSPSTSNFPSAHPKHSGADSGHGGRHADAGHGTIDTQPEPLSLLDTVPGLAQQLELGTWLASSSSVQNNPNSLTPVMHPKDYFKSDRRLDVLNVHASAPVTPIPGGDLGMRFAPGAQQDPLDADEDRIRPLEGEVVTAELSHQGGFAVVTTAAAAPPKELCYACGSGGGQLLFCVSCAEPFHFYCVERQFRPRRKDHFICRNCTSCRRCSQPAADLRCVRCSNGYHPHCLPDYAPAQSGQRGNWVCPSCTVCVHCGLRPLGRPSEDPPGTSATDQSSILVLWSPESSKCAACSAAEARGDICPECDRAYLPSAKQMIQCDTCQLWMHRTCARLTADEYEFIARLPSGQLNKFVVNCTVCQNERKQQDEAADSEPAATDVPDGASRLRALARETLLERMANLSSGCRRTVDSESQLAPSSSMSPPSAARLTGDSTSTQSAQTPDSSRMIPQLDGVFDGDLDDGHLKSPNICQTSAAYGKSALAPGPDSLNPHDQLDPSGTSSPASFTSDVSMRLQHTDESSHAAAYGKAFVPVFPFMPPPTEASWIVENETKQQWTSPRFLIYRVLARILHRLAACPVNSNQAISLRRLLRWLSTTIESLFPWLNISEMVNDVRDVHRQVHGEFDAVLRHFEKCAVLEMHELLCPVVARHLDLSLYSRLTLTTSFGRPWNNVTRVHKSFTSGLQHLRSHHASLVNATSEAVSDSLSPNLVIQAKCAAASATVGLSQCTRPHEMEVMEKMRNETREERWVEHWSTLEEELVLGKFQRHLQRCYKRLTKTTHPSEPASNENSAGDSDGHTTALDTPSRKAQVASSENPIGRFYFASDSYWTASMGSKRPSQKASSVGVPVDLDEDEFPRPETPVSEVSSDQSSSEEDVRRCLLCAGHGDSNIEGRLLFTGADTWVHVNCALWSNEVYEEETGQLIGLSDAIRRASLSRCSDCQQYGATLLCSNAHEAVCSLHSNSWESANDSTIPKAVHFACALRRRPPSPKSVFTADRSWFCSLDCHQSAMRQRLADAIRMWRQRKHTRLAKAESQSGDVDISECMNKEDYSMLENSVADDLEPISLGELLVCRRVFVPSDCFVAAFGPSRFNVSSMQCRASGDNSRATVDAIHQALSNLAVSPNSMSFLRGSGLPASALIVTIGSLRVDRLGEVREASDALALQKSLPDVRQADFLCPIHYRARRIYWSCHKLDERVSYTLHVKQAHAMNHAISTALTHSSTSQDLVPKPVVVPKQSEPSAQPLLTPVQWRLTNRSYSDQNNDIRTVSRGPEGTVAVRTPTNPRPCGSHAMSTQSPPKVNCFQSARPTVSTAPLTSSAALCKPGATSSHPVTLGTMTNTPSASLRIVQTVSLPKTTTNFPLQPPRPPIRILSTVTVPATNSNNITTNNNNDNWKSPIRTYSTIANQGRPAIFTRAPVLIPVKSPSLPGNRIVPSSSVMSGVNKLNQIPIVRTVVQSHLPRTTPTKDLHLANQLNGILQNLPRSGQVLPNPASTNKVNNHFPNAVVNGSSNVTICIRSPQRLLPQFDGTMDSDDDMDSYSRRSVVSRKRSGVAVHDPSTTATPRSTAGQPMSKVFPHSQPKRRWIEERNRQQELAQLVSKAKLANHARLYQNEVEKHARSFKLRFTVDGIVRAATTPASAWRHVLFRVASLRDKQGLPALITDSGDGWTQFGLNNRHIIFMIEQMRGAFHCYRYRFRYHWRKIENLRRKFTPPLPVPEGCARAIPWNKPHLPGHHARDPLSFLGCKANPPPQPLIHSSSTSTTAACATVSPGRNTVLPTQPPEPAMLLSPNEQRVCAEAAREAAALVAAQLKLPIRIRDACIAQAVVQATGLPVNPIRSRKSLTDQNEEAEQQQQLNDSAERSESDTSGVGAMDVDEPDFGTVTTQFKRMVSGHMARYLRVTVHPSRIHGRGLFALRGFREDEMVIEYLGELIRNFVCETRELRYRAAGVDCYMFRIDQDLVIDATYAGNAARFINHSCEPNCYAKVITVEDKKHIIILAQRRIYPGEELTYDYRFPKESDKLLCNCGSFNCRKYLN